MTAWLQPYLVNRFFLILSLYQYSEIKLGAIGPNYNYFQLKGYLSHCEATSLSKHCLPLPRTFTQQLVLLSLLVQWQKTPILDTLSAMLLACCLDGSVLGLCQCLQQILLHYIKKYAMLESFHSLIMCAFWPQATTSHPLLSLTWQPRILGGFPKLFCITCQKEILTDLL